MTELDRFQTMSLGSQGPSTIPNHSRLPITSYTNRVDDIEGAVSELKYMRYTARRPDLYNTEDIDGSHPMRLHATGPRGTPRARTAVEGSKPRPLQFKSQRHVNPLEPEYVLPSCRMEPPPVPKFVRDGYTVADIEGTAPRSRYRFKQRETYEVDDIEGARAGWRPRHERVRREGPPRDGLDVRDINDVGFKTRRSTDPLRPTFSIHGMDIFDDPIKTRPKCLPKAHAGPTRSLHTDDIEGARAGWKPPHEMQPPLEKRRHFRNTNFVGDITGAQPDTVKHAIRTMRATNPLNPAYRSLDGEILPDPTQPDFSHIFEHFLGPDSGRQSKSGGSRPTSTSRYIKTGEAPAPAVDRFVLKSSDGRPRVATASPRPSARSAPGSRGGALRTKTPAAKREAAQAAADKAAVLALA